MAEPQVLNSYVEISYTPRWAYVEAIREFVKNFCVISSFTQELSEKIMMATSELLENAIKYGVQDELYFRLEISSDHNHIQMTVKNTSSPENQAVLRQELETLNLLPPKEAYLKKLFEVAQDTSKSRLGLARIRYEAEGSLQMKTQGNQVIVCAHFPLRQQSAGNV